VPQKPDIHLIVDNYSTHKHARVKSWLVKRPRWHINFAPTYSAWSTLVERFFALITDKAVRRGSFTRLKDLTRARRKSRLCAPGLTLAPSRNERAFGTWW
jgi:putative transposase